MKAAVLMSLFFFIVDIVFYFNLNEKLQLLLTLLATTVINLSWLQPSRWVVNHLSLDPTVFIDEGLLPRPVLPSNRDWDPPQSVTHLFSPGQLVLSTRASCDVGHKDFCLC